MFNVAGHLYERIVSSVLDDVRAGKLQPGDRVPSEHDLAAQFKVSRITSRRALEELARMNVVERAQGRGTFITRAKNQAEASTKNATSPTNGASAHTGQRSRLNMIGLILPDFAEVFGLHTVYAVEDACARAGQCLILKRTHNERALEEDTIQSLLEQGVNGLIVFPIHSEHYNPVLLKAVLSHAPVVLVDRYLKGIPAHAVVTDNHAASGALTEHLIKLGHEKIAYISPPVTNTSTLEERLRGYTETLSRHGLRVRAEHQLLSLRLTMPGRTRLERIASDQDTLRKFLRATDATAFVCAEHSLAQELTALLEDKGKRVPEDYSVVCFDSPDRGDHRFTHIRQDETLIGRTAVELLLQLVRGETPAMRTNVDFALVVGHSTSALRKSKRAG